MGASKSHLGGAKVGFRQVKPAVYFGAGVDFRRVAVATVAAVGGTDAQPSSWQLFRLEGALERIRRRRRDEVK